MKTGRNWRCLSPRSQKKSQRLQIQSQRLQKSSQSQRDGPSPTRSPPFQSSPVPVPHRPNSKPRPRFPKQSLTFVDNGLVAVLGSDPYTLYREWYNMERAKPDVWTNFLQVGRWKAPPSRDSPMAFPTSHRWAWGSPWRTWLVITLFNFWSEHPFFAGPDGEMVMNPIPGEAGTDYPVFTEGRRPQLEKL